MPYTPTTWDNDVTEANETTLNNIEAGIVAATEATDGAGFGSDRGVLAQPWAPSPTVGPEYWQLTYFQSGGGYNTSTLSPSITANGTGQIIRTRVSVGNQANGDATYRLEFDYAVPVTGGWAAISLLATQSGGSTYGGTTEQFLITGASQRLSGHYLFDFKPPPTGGLYLEIKMECASNVASGVLSMSNVSLKQTGDLSRPLMVSQEYNTGNYPLTWFQLYDVPNRSWRIASLSFGDDGALTPVAFVDVKGYLNDQPFNNIPPDPLMVRASSVGSSSVDTAFATATATSLRVNNNDQIMSVYNGSAYELRGNVHGGEVNRGAGATYKIDYGAGLVSWTMVRGLTGCRRFQVTIPSEYRRSTDGTTAYANVDRIHTVFPDGVVRTDRTTTFLSTQSYDGFFEWMSSHDTTVPYVGRLGRGSTVFAEIDTHPLAAVPATPGSSTSTSGGTLAAATYSYVVTALTPYGETTPSVAKTQATTGSTSTVTVTWSAVTNATGYKVYGRVAGVERHLVTLPAVLTWTDTGANGGNVLPPTVNTARVYNSTIATMSASSTAARWAVWKEPRSGWCYGNIYDSTAVLARSQVSEARTRIEGVTGSIQKIYANLAWSNSSDIISIPSSTVWTATHWSFVYIPENPDRYHNEIAARASNLSALASMYPST
jgi:hypothetical protein